MLEIRPCDYATARDFVKENHRHNKPPAGHKFSIACYDGDRLCGVAGVVQTGLTTLVQCSTEQLAEQEKHLVINGFLPTHGKANREQV